MESNQDGSEVLETTEAVAEEQATQEETATEQSEVSQTDEEKEQLRKDKQELETKNKQLFERLKKAEASKSSSTDGISSLDAVALVSTGITHEEDIEAAIEFAAFKKTTVREALKNPTLKTILATNAETRKTADATNTRSTSRGTSKVSAEDYLRKAERGETIDTEEGLQAIFNARMAKKRPNRK